MDHSVGFDEKFIPQRGLHVGSCFIPDFIVTNPRN